jgi:methylenetetrahydrofolate dehydrogenase (NADP+)/methenyltetrahydrofolate cyclohydrolase
VLVGDDPASQIYIRLKHKAATEAGMETTDLRLPDDISEDELVRKVEELSADDAVDALLVQLPLPRHIDETRVIRAIDPMKDVDGLHPFNAGQLFLGRPGLVGATPVGLMSLLHEYAVELDGARAVVVGRSDIVGKPMFHLLMQANATVTLCHSHTKDLGRHTLDADVLVVAAGVPALVSPDMVKTGGVVVDVGMNRTEVESVGDVDAGADDVASLITLSPAASAQ